MCTDEFFVQRRSDDNVEPDALNEECGVDASLCIVLFLLSSIFRLTERTSQMTGGLSLAPRIVNKLRIADPQFLNAEGEISTAFFTRHIRFHIVVRTACAEDRPNDEKADELAASLRESRTAGMKRQVISMHHSVH